MMLRRIAAFIPVLMITGLVSAQTPTAPAPWPPDPETLFAPGIQWSIFDEFAVSAETPITIDHQARVLNVYDAANGTAHEYPFPEGKSVRDAEFQSDGYLRINISGYPGYSPDSTLILNPETGAYEPPAVLCDGHALQDLPGEGHWIEVGQSYENPFLCQTATDERIIPTKFRLDWNSLIANVDETRLILVAYPDYGSEDESQIVLYDLTSEQITPLGSGLYQTPDDSAHLCDKLTPTKILICVRNTAFDFMPMNYYTFDLTQPNSLESVFSGWGSTIITLDHPRRYIVIDSENYSAFETGGGNWEQPCQVRTYDGTELRTHVLGGECIPVLWMTDMTSPVYRVGDDFFYLATEKIALPFPPPNAPSTLHRFNSETATISDALLTGELEMILGVSPDERYIALAVDDNGVLDFPWQPGSYTGKEWPIAILDLHSGEIVYQTKPLQIGGAGDVEWIDNDSLILFSGETWRIDLAGDQAVVHRTNEYTGHYPDDEICLGDTRDFLIPHFNKYLMLVDLATFEATPLLQSDARTEYSMQTSCYGLNGVLKLHIYSDQGSVTYQVKLPQ